MPGKPDAADKLYQHLMQMQEQAFNEGRFEVSFIVIASCLECVF